MRTAGFQDISSSRSYKFSDFETIRKEDTEELNATMQSIIGFGDKDFHASSGTVLRFGNRRYSMKSMTAKSRTDLDWKSQEEQGNSACSNKNVSNIQADQNAKVCDDEDALKNAVDLQCRTCVIAAQIFLPRRVGVGGSTQTVTFRTRRAAKKSRKENAI